MAERILIVDDDKHMRASLKTELESEGFEVITAENGSKAIELAKEEHFDLVLCDVRMPDIDGIETVASISEYQPRARSIMITAYASHEAPISALKLGVDDYLLKPFSIDELLRSIRASLIRSKQSACRSEGPSQYKKNFLKIIRGILFESKISHLLGHSEHVARLSLGIARNFGFSPAQMQNLYLASLLHDIGYMELPPHLLEKAEFEAADWELVKNHPLLARDLLSPFSELKEISTIILYHHERWDGSGYPQGLSGARIPLESRIIAAAEAYDSLISGRPHRTKKNVPEALKMIEKGAGAQFDPEIVKRLASVVGLYHKEEIPPIPDEEEKQIAILLSLGDIYREIGDIKVAQDAYAKAKDSLGEKDSYELRVRAGMGEVLLLSREGRLDEAHSRAVEILDFTNEKSMQFLHAQVLTYASYLKMKRGEYQDVEDDLKRAREIFAVWESSYSLCEVDFLLSALYAMGGERDLKNFSRSYESFLRLAEEEQAFELLARYRDLAPAILRRSIEKELFPIDTAQLFKKFRKAPVEVLESLLEDGDTRVRLGALDILKLMKDGRIRQHLQRLQMDPGETVREKASQILASLPGTLEIPQLQIFFLGKFRVMVGNTILSDDAWITRKAKSLFAYLVSRPGEEVSEDKLMDLFWYQGGAKARHALHNCISVIRKIFAPSLGEMARKMIINQKSFYFLNRSLGCTTDLEQFEEHFHKGRTLFDQKQYQEALPELQKAERLYGGEFMEGSYDEWSDDLRLSTRNRYVELLHLLGRYFFEKNKYEVSIDYWKKILALDNCYDDAYQGLMLCHVAISNVNEAIKVYHQCAKTLKKELSLSPPAKIMELYLKLIEGHSVPLKL